MKTLSIMTLSIKLIKHDTEHNGNQHYGTALSVIYAQCHKYVPYAKCRYAEYYYAKCL